LGATVREQMTFLHWFARHRPNVEAIIISTDEIWCKSGPRLPHIVDFPYGLYSDSTLEYLGATLSSRTLRFMKERVEYALRRRRGVERECYYDIEAKLVWPGPSVTARDWAMATTATPPKVALPGLRLLDASLHDVPGEPFVVMWFPPYYAGSLAP